MTNYLHLHLKVLNIVANTVTSLHSSWSLALLTVYEKYGNSQTEETISNTESMDFRARRVFRRAPHPHVIL